VKKNEYGVINKGSGLVIKHLCRWDIPMARPLRIEFAGAVHHIMGIS
jgi:hypothetical protein